MWETFMDFIMARKALREAAKQGETKSPPPKGPQNVDYVRKQAEAQAERERKKKLESEAKKGPAKGAANILSNP
jgi:DNA invertase Pin-like site-specific DNA recombinase